MGGSRTILVIAILLCVGGAAFVLGPKAAEPSPSWKKLESGLSWIELPAPASSGFDATVRVLRVDPKRFKLRLLNASNPKYGKSLTPKQWAARHGLVAAINASMYQRDYLSSVSLMKTGGHVNNPRVSKDKTVLAFDPTKNGEPEIRIIDRECDDLDSIGSNYRTLVQSIRMISCRGRNVWQQQERRVATTAIGIDTRGHLMMIHIAKPLTTHDAIDLLMQLPLGLDRAMYSEGGTEAQLFVGAGGLDVELTGQHESLLDSGLSTPPIPVPNVIGISRR